MSRVSGTSVKAEQKLVGIGDCGVEIVGAQRVGEDQENARQLLAGVP